MKKNLLYLVLSLFSSISFGQVSDQDAKVAFALLQSNQTVLGLSEKDISNMEVSASYEDPASKIRYVYMIQNYAGLLVHNQILSLTFRDGKLLSKAGKLAEYIDQRVTAKEGKPSVSPEMAVTTALIDRKYTNTTQPIIKGSEKNGRKFIFGKLNAAEENITAELKWLPHATDKTIHLVWEVYIVSANSSDYWLVYVDALSNAVIHIDNLTVYENGTHQHDHTSTQHNQHSSTNCTSHAVETESKTASSAKADESPSLIVSATYRVIPFPAENPEAPGGAPAVVNNPWLAAPGNATTLNWHTGIGGTNYNYTRGNNVWAYHDRAATNAALESKSTPSKHLILSDFDYVPDFNVDPTQTAPVPNQQFNTTNVFYWSNIIHDIMYLYGFTEPAGNFQEDNLGRGGLGVDYVRAEAQDGGGMNNANFATPVDGSLPRMQMFLWDYSVPDRDGDVDNGVIVHEYAHGISNRLTGGPNVASCLSNAEHMGEGWSDYYSMMFTQDWANSNLNSGFTTQRTLGLYALNGTNLFPASPPGTGIRNFPYSTNMAISPQVYMSSMATSPHTRGETWAAVLWDMTWNIIQQVGVINPNLYNVAGGGGNVIALKLVTEGMKLQPCSPGFIDGRDAIIQADINLYGGVHVCAIKEAFRRRGMGALASQGLSTSVTDQTPDYSSEDFSLSLLTNNISSTPAGNNFQFTNRIEVGTCGPLVNFTLRDTLPANVDFVSATNGGTYNPGNRVITWTVNQAAGTTVDYNFVVFTPLSSFFPPISIINQPVTSPIIPASWTTTSTTATFWTVTNTESKSAPYSFFSQELASTSDQQLTTVNSFALPATPLQLSFWHRYNTENRFDGGVVEISLDGGATWNDIGPNNFIENGYNVTMNASAAALSSRLAFSGNSNGFIKSVVDLTPYINQADVRLRFRFSSDLSVTVQGWFVDDITIEKIPSIDIRSSLFNASDERVIYSDTTVVITEAQECNLPVISSIDVIQPACGAPVTGTITVNATGSGPLEYSIDGVQYQSSSIFSGLAPDDYNIFVRLEDNVECVLTYTLNPVVVQPQPLVPAIPGDVEGPTNVCQYVGTADQLVYSVQPVPGATQYNWEVPPTVTLINGQGTNTITVTVNGNFLTNVNRMFRVTASSPCGTSGERLFWLLAQFPTTPAPIQASTNDICPFIGTGNAVTYKIPKVTGATSYIWTAQAGTTTILHPEGLGPNDTLVTVSFTNGFTSSMLSVIAVNDCGVSGSRSLLLQRQSASTTGLINGPTNVCEHIGPSGTPAAYSVPLMSNASLYTWVLPAGAYDVNGQGTNSISFMYPPGFTNGVVSVSASNGCGTGGTRSLAVSKLNPSAPSAIDATVVNVCPNRTMMYSISNVSLNATSILWTVPAGATILNGQGTYSITVEYPSTAISGNVTAQAINNCGSSAARSIKVKLASCPDEPQTFTKVMTTKDQPIGVQVFPNPTSNVFEVIVESLQDEKIMARITDIHGRSLQQMNLLPYSRVKFGERLKPGVYLLEVLQGNQRVVKRLIKL